MRFFNNGVDIKLALRILPLVILLILICLLVFVSRAKSEQPDKIELGHRIGLTKNFEVLQIEVDANIQVVVGESNHDRKIREAEEKRLAELRKRDASYNLEIVEQWRPLVTKYFGDQATNCLRVMKPESGGNPNIVNNNPRTEDYSVGLMQINLYGRLALTRPSEAWLKVPENNIKYAHQMWQTQGWGPWTTAHSLGIV